MLQPPEGPPFDNELIPAPGIPIYIQLQGFVQLDEAGNLHFTNQKLNGSLSLSSVAHTLFKTVVGDTTVYFATVLIPYDAETTSILINTNGPLKVDAPGEVIVKPPVPPVPKGDEFSVNYVYAQFSA